LYGHLAYDVEDEPKRAAEIARVIECRAWQSSWSAGSVVATEAELRVSLNAGHESLRQALRVLEARGACCLRRGAGGGLVMMPRPTAESALHSLSRYLRLAGVPAGELREALEDLDWMERNRVCRSSSSGGRDIVGEERPGGRASLSSNRVMAFCAKALLMALGERGSGDQPTGAAVAPRSRCAEDISHAGRKKKTCASLQLADRISEDLQSAVPDRPVFLGTQDDLCSRYGVSPATLRQALSILEAEGVCGVKRGREGGVYSCTPRPGPAIDMAVRFMARREWRRDLLDFTFEIGVVTASVAALRWTVGDAIPRIRNVDPIMESVMLWRSLWKAMRNRPLEIIARSVVASALHFFGVSTLTDLDSRRLGQLSRNIIDAVSRNEVLAAEHAFLVQAALIRTAFTPVMRPSESCVSQ
jgi:DNA-binding FadR family transcriptional regulator